MRAYERMFKGEPELEILKALGYFDRPAERAALTLVLSKSLVKDASLYEGALAQLRILRLVLPDDGSGTLEVREIEDTSRRG